MKKKIFQIIIFFILSHYSKAQEIVDFKPCGDGRYYPYYNNKLSYTPDFYIVKNYFKSNYKNVEFTNIDNNTGMIHIFFNVNCKGETGNYSIETFDFDYKFCIINELIKSKILKLTKELKIWQAVNEKEQIQNFHKYYIFKIKNGTLVEILLK